MCVFGFFSSSSPFLDWSAAIFSYCLLFGWTCAAWLSGALRAERLMKRLVSVFFIVPLFMCRTNGLSCSLTSFDYWICVKIGSFGFFLRYAGPGVVCSVFSYVTWVVEIRRN